LPFNPELDQALEHGTSIGRVRAKAQIEAGDMKYIGKFSSVTDLYSVVKAEFVAMRLAALSGLDIALVSLTWRCTKTCYKRLVQSRYTCSVRML
jgi:serine/threonine-protein kinase HipA